mgnify:CR=1 FL=1
MKPEKFKVKILEIKQLTDSVKHFVFSSGDFNFVPGQYASMILDNSERKVRRPYSIASVPGKESFEIVIKLIENGLASPIIDNLKVGDEVEFIGPMGEFVIENEEKNLVFISTGTGIGPFRCMINYLIEKGFEKEIILFAGYRDKVLYDDEFKKLGERFNNFKYYSILSSSDGRVQKLLEKIPEKYDADFYVCGLKEMINSVRINLVKKGFKMKNIFSEKYD